MQRAEDEIQKHGNLYNRQTDRRNSAKHKEIGQHVAAFHHMGKGKKEENESAERMVVRYAHKKQQ
jgi:hypothetical protein